MKGGSGKTTAAVHIAVAAAQQGRNVAQPATATANQRGCFPPAASAPGYGTCRSSAVRRLASSGRRS